MFQKSPQKTEGQDLKKTDKPETDNRGWGETYLTLCHQLHKKILYVTMDGEYNENLRLFRDGMSS